jgi:hypothetical protein
VCAILGALLIGCDEAVPCLARERPRLLQDCGRSTLEVMSVDVVRAVYEAGIAGDVEPLVSLIHPQMEWRGRRRLRQFWRPPPS